MTLDQDYAQPDTCCTWCGGSIWSFLGQLGRKAYYRCRGCGHVQSH